MTKEFVESDWNQIPKWEWLFYQSHIVGRGGERYKEPSFFPQFTVFLLYSPNPISKYNIPTLGQNKKNNYQEPQKPWNTIMNELSYTNCETGFLFAFFQGHSTFLKFSIMVATKSRINYFPHIMGRLHHWCLSLCLSCHKSFISDVGKGGWLCL